MCDVLWRQASCLPGGGYAYQSTPPPPKQAGTASCNIRGSRFAAPISRSALIASMPVRTPIWRSALQFASISNAQTAEFCMRLRKPAATTSQHRRKGEGEGGGEGEEHRTRTSRVAPSHVGHGLGRQPPGPQVLTPSTRPRDRLVDAAMGVAGSVPAEPERGKAGLRPLDREVGSRWPQAASKPSHPKGNVNPITSRVTVAPLFLFAQWNHNKNVCSVTCSCDESIANGNILHTLVSGHDVF